jgi:hypothetical protein
MKFPTRRNVIFLIGIVAYFTLSAISYNLAAWYLVAVSGAVLIASLTGKLLPSESPRRNASDAPGADRASDAAQAESCAETPTR